MGIDKAIHIKTDLELDSQVHPLLIARIFKKIVERDQYNLVLLGKQSVDTDYNQTGQLLAGMLNWPQATFASKLQFSGNKVTVDREIDQGITTVIKSFLHHNRSLALCPPVATGITLWPPPSRLPNLPRTQA